MQARRSRPRSRSPRRAGDGIEPALGLDLRKAETDAVAAIGQPAQVFAATQQRLSVLRAVDQSQQRRKRQMGVPFPSEQKVFDLRRAGQLRTAARQIEYPDRKFAAVSAQYERVEINWNPPMSAFFASAR